MTRQTGQVLTPTASPDGDEIAFLSDSGGHSNLWVTSTQSGDPRGRSRSRTIPRCRSARRCGHRTGTRSRSSRRRASPVSSSACGSSMRDGSNLRNLAMPGLGMAWSPDGKMAVLRRHVRGCAEEGRGVRRHAGHGAIGADAKRHRPVWQDVVLHGRASARRWTAGVRNPRGHAGGRPVAPARADSRVARASLADRQSFPLTRRTMARACRSPMASRPTSGRSRRANGEWRQVTDFGDRAIFIARRVSWSARWKSPSSRRLVKAMPTSSCSMG